MKIGVINPCNTVSFSAKNKSIRDADDIRRRAVKEFPMISASSGKMFYVGAKKGSPHYKEENKILDNLAEKISVMRFVSNMSENDSGETMVPSLQYIKKYKCGNCAESALVTLAALQANGFDDSKKCELYLNSKIINKKNQKKEDEANHSLDHEFVVTTMGKHSQKTKDVVVVDSWAGFSDSYSGAVDKYKGIYSDKMKKTEDKYLHDFLINKGTLFPFISKKNYEVRSNLMFVTSEPKPYYHYYRLGCFANNLFPSLVTEGNGIKNHPLYEIFERKE